MKKKGKIWRVNFYFCHGGKKLSWFSSAKLTLCKKYMKLPWEAGIIRLLKLLLFWVVFFFCFPKSSFFFCCLNQKKLTLDNYGNNITTSGHKKNTQNMVGYGMKKWGYSWFLPRSDCRFMQPIRDNCPIFSKMPLEEELKID